MIDSLIQDIAFGFRLMYKNLKFTLVIILCLTLGIGPNATIFSVVNMLILTPPDVAEPNKLVYVQSIDLTRPKSQQSSLSYLHYKSLLSSSKTLKDIAAESTAQTSVVLPGGAVLCNAQVVSSNFFDLLERKPLLGEVFHSQEHAFPGTQPWMVLGYHFWKEKLAGDEQIFGQTLLVNSYKFKVLGVMPESFTGSISGYQPDFWAPLMMIDQLRPSASGRLDEDDHRWLMSFGRLEPGATLDDANRELTQIGEQLARIMPETMQNRGFRAARFNGLGGAPKQAVNGVTGLLFAVVGLVLLVACSSVAALLLARSTARRREISIRMAMGATRRRLVRMLLMESLLMAVLAGGLALLLTMWTLDLIFAMIPTETLPLYLDAALDFRILGFTLLVSLGSGFLFGLAPALQATKPDLMSALKDQPISGSVEKRVSRMRSAFIIAQFACSMVLLILAGLFVKSLYHAYKVDPGFKTSNLLDYHLDPGLQGYVGDETGPFAANLKKHVQEIPGVKTVGLARLGPLPTHRTSTVVTPLERDLTTGPDIRLRYNYVGPEYFAAMEIPIVAGRPFTETDRSPRSASGIVNETFAKKAWPDQEPLGRFISVPGLREAAQVVGVARDARYYTMGEEQSPYIYLPIGLNFNHELSLVISCEKGAEAMRPLIENAIKDCDSNLLLSGLSSVDHVISRSLWPARIAAVLFGLLGLLALLLAIIGVYGVMSYSVNLRQQEIGIRMALGGVSKELVFLLMKRGVFLVSLGGFLGLGLAFALTRFLVDLLSGVSPTDPFVFVLVPSVLVVTACLSIYFPARRMTRINPMVSLRYE